jgi:hypothetical protein
MATSESKSSIFHPGARFLSLFWERVEPERQACNSMGKGPFRGTAATLARSSARRGASFMGPSDKAKEAGKGSVDTAMAGFTTATKNMQVIAGEIAKMSMDSYENSAQLIEKLRSAKSWEDIVAIQTGYMKTAYENFSSRTQKLGEIMGTMPQEMARTYQQLFDQGRQGAQAAGEAAKQAGEHAADQIKDATKT